MVTTRFKTKFNKDYFEATAWSQQQLVCGIDEVGRGCLAGPVVVAALILHPNKKSRLIKDSKELTKEERLQAYKWLIKHSWFSTALVDHRTIDAINIYQATLMAMKRAFMQLMATVPNKPSTIVIDAMPLNLEHTAYNNLDVLYFPFGEKKSTSIAGASIIAKVTRDALMQQLDPLFPGYHLAQHKGYSTPLHKRSVAEMGRSLIHRNSFLNFLNTISPNLDDEYEEQQTLC